MIQNNLLYEFMIRQLYHFATDFDHCYSCWALTLRTACINTEWSIRIRHLRLKHLNCWWKAVKNLICYSCIFNV